MWPNHVDQNTKKIKNYNTEYISQNDLTSTANL